jgi:hypothetical protein
MAYGIYDFEVEQGTTFGADLTVKDEDGNIRDLTTYTARLYIKTHRGEATPTDIWNSGQEITMQSVSPNIRITVGASATAGYLSGVYEYDLEIEQNNVVEKVLVGKIKVLGEVSR